MFLALRDPATGFRIGKRAQVMGDRMVRMRKDTHAPWI